VVRLTTRWIDIACSMAGAVASSLRRTAALVFYAATRFALLGYDVVPHVRKDTTARGAVSSRCRRLAPGRRT